MTWTLPITVHIFVATQRFPSHKLDKLRTLFLNLNNHSKGKTILTSIKKSITGVSKVKDEDYDELRHILQTLEQLAHKKK
ncbi:hypothetical protein QUF82_21485 [Thiotrichales bacterium HSG14]|nr:hypothetical protein [Thiotrichales bacterium HSG14]